MWGWFGKKKLDVLSSSQLREGQLQKPGLNMANFLHIIENIGHGLIVADRIAAPIVTMIDPPVGAAMNAIGALVVKAEQTFPTQGQGAIKKAAVLDWFFTLMPMFQQVLKAQGFEFSVDQEAVSKLIDAQVAQLNAAGLFKTAFIFKKIENPS